MTSVTVQRDLVVNLKKEIYLNVGILSKLRPMPAELTRQIFKENVLEKLTQTIFNHLSYYLVSIIDPNVADKFSWPLYDSKTERAFRNQLSIFVNDYSSKGLLSPVMSSYLVNPGCYKVTMLLFQMSQLAVQRMLTSKMVKENQKDLYSKMTNKYKSTTEGFLEDIEKETDFMSSKFSNYLRKREAMEKIAAMFRDKILSMEQTLASSNAGQIIDKIVDKYIKQASLDEAAKAEILKIKNVQQPCPIFDYWLDYVDKSVSELESQWSEKISPFHSLCLNCKTNTEALIARHTGEADRNSYMIEYNHSTDEICTNDLQNQVNSQQKYILKNIIRNERLYFPNLIRGFLISICYILKNNEIGDEIYKFNEYLENSHRNFNEIINAMRNLNDRVMNAEEKLEMSPLIYNQSIPVKAFDIPPLPDLSDLKANRDNLCQVLFNTFTPLSTSKHQFNLRRKHNSFSFSKPTLPVVTPFHQAPRDDFLRSVVSCRINSYDQNATHNFHNLSVISQVNNRGNETIAECSAGFTKQQIMRLLSTKKSSSSKKFRHKHERPNINIKKGGLFNDSTVSNDSNGLFRSYSSPNLFENREKRSNKNDKRKLSIMQEDIQSILEVSGIVALEKDGSFSTPDSCSNLKLVAIDKLTSENESLPPILITPDENRNINNLLQNLEVDLNTELTDNSISKSELSDNKLLSNIEIDFKGVIDNKSVANEESEPRKSIDTKEDSKTETPKMNAPLHKKTSSLEKIINRFKKVRANVIQSEKNEDIKTIIEEKENMNVNIDVFTANKILLPDLLSPSCNVLTLKPTDFLDQFCIDFDETEDRKPRQSLGTALGVDETFLDQFDLID